jgi:hypothetical protein
MTQTPSTRVLVERVTAYIRDYRNAMRFVLADEDYQQAVYDTRGQKTAARHLRGELFLAWVPGDARWIAVHDVQDVDGEPVRDRENLQQLLRQGEVTAVAGRVANRNAAFNVGRVQRNFNEPTLPLLLFDADRLRGVAFDMRSEGPRVPGSEGPNSATLLFRERETPTLVRSVRGRWVPANGEIVADVTTGTVQRTRFALRDDLVEVELLTYYQREPKIDLWVPTLFLERYDAWKDPRGEMILCQARYSNYRRFEVSGRIR